MPIEQKNIDKLHSILVGCAAVTLVGQLERKLYIETLAQDIFDFCCEGKWTSLDVHYKSAWLGEILRRIALAFPDPKSVVFDEGSKNPKATRELIEKFFSADAIPVDVILFSQFTINPNFKGLNNDAPAWLANKSILEAAEILSISDSASQYFGLPSDRSNSLRIGLYRHADQWITMNNRGFALHSLANVKPQRIVFRPHLSLSSDETRRLNATMPELNFKNSEPALRRRKADWEATIPTSVAAVTVTKNSLNVAYTIKAMPLSSNGPDQGNATVMNARKAISEKISDS